MRLKGLKNHGRRGKHADCSKPECRLAPPEGAASVRVQDDFLRFREPSGDRLCRPFSVDGFHVSAGTTAVDKLFLPVNIEAFVDQLGVELSDRVSDGPTPSEIRTSIANKATNMRLFFNIFSSSCK